MKKRNWLSLCFLCMGLIFYFFLKQPPISEKVVICGVCKNVAKHLPKTIESIEKTGSLFRDYRVVIYENNSVDDTKNILKAWAKKNRRIEVISEDVTQEKLLSSVHCYTADHKPFRTELIARARNIVLERVLSEDFEEYKFVIMADLDFRKSWNFKGIIDSFQKKEKWDAILANGISETGKVYDFYALRCKEYLFGPEIFGEEWWKTIRQSNFQMETTPSLIPVYSAFGGLGIYKRESIKGCRYSGVVTEDLEKVTQQIMKMEPHHPEVIRYLNQKNLEKEGVYLNPQGIRWVMNSDSISFPSCCEHVTFHAQMIEKGCDKIFINPKMVMRYRWEPDLYQ